MRLEKTTKHATDGNAGSHTETNLLKRNIMRKFLAILALALVTTTGAKAADGYDYPYLVVTAAGEQAVLAVDGLTIAYSSTTLTATNSDGTQTFAHLKNKINNISYMHVNTHLDYKYYENRIRQIKVVINFISKFNEKYPILLTGDFNCGNEKWEIEQGDAVPYLLSHGFFDASKESKDCCISWTFPSIGYHKKIYDSCLKRRKHKNGINLDDQKFCESECDEENGKIIDFCFRSNNKICFQKLTFFFDLILLHPRKRIN